MEKMKSHTQKIFWRGGELTLERCRVMGILNVTPDSFSDGGLFLDEERAVQRAWKIAEEGADLLDIGAESTRPGAPAVHVEEEARRLFPILRRLHTEKYPLPISLDTSKPSIAHEALMNNWIQIVNDVEGLRNPEMVSVVKQFESPVVLMHMFGSPRTMQEDFQYEDVVQDIIAFFKKRLREIDFKENVILDPGIGFGKSVEHNLTLIRRLREFEILNCPIMIGVSRKSFIGKVLDVEVHDRLEGGLAAMSVAVSNGARIVRVHDVLSTVRFLRMWAQITLNS